MASDFEKKYFQPPCYWVSDLQFDAIKSELILSVVGDPEIGVVDGVFTFTNIVTYQGQFTVDDFAPNCLEILVGIDANDTSEGVKYCINFDIGEIIFTTNKEPIIDWKDPDKCRVDFLHEEKIKLL